MQNLQKDIPQSQQLQKQQQPSSISDSSIQSVIQLQQVKKELLQKNIQDLLVTSNHRDFLVSTGLSFEITDYFKFENRQQLKQQNSAFKNLNQQSYIAWIILLVSVLSSAMVPPWLMSIKADKLLRVSWKCFLQCFTVAPFVLYERRSKNQKVINQYKLSYIFNKTNLKKVWILAFTASFWPTTILTTIQWTYISHCFVLGSLTNLFLSFQRLYYGKTKTMQKGGQLIAVLGILFVIYDSIQLNPQEATDYQRNVYNPFYLTRKWWQRPLGDLGALMVGYCMSQLSKKTSDIKQYYPPYLLLFLNNLFTSIFMIFSAFFFNGATFDANSMWGVFALFTTAHFTNFLLLATLLGASVFISFSLVSKLFSDPVVIAIAMTMQPIISTILWHIVGVQTIPGPYACFGYILIIPGIITILIGNCLQTRTKIKDQVQTNKSQAKSINQIQNNKNRQQSEKQDFQYDNKQY